MGIVCLYVLIQKSGQKAAKSHLCAVVWDAILSTLVLFYRSTWAVFPYTLLFLCWHSLALRAGKIFSLIKEKKNQPVTADAPKGFMLGASTAMGWVLLWGFQDHMQNNIPCGTPIMFWDDVAESCLYVNKSTPAITDWKREEKILFTQQQTTFMFYFF